MVNRDDIDTNFQNMGITASDEVLDKCLELCILYKVDAEEFVDQWLAFTLTNLKNAPPTLDGLNQLERKELQKAMKAAKKVYIDESDDVVEKPQPKRVDLNTSVTNSPSQRFTQRSDSLNVLCNFGSATSYRKEPTSNFQPTVKFYGTEDFHVNTKYMYEKMGVRAKCLDNITQKVADYILKNRNLDASLYNFKTHTGEMVTFGRIYSSDEAGKMSPDLLVLEGTMEVNKGQTRKLNLDRLKRFALFPGQIAVIKGINTKDYFIVEELHTDAALPLTRIPEFTDKLQIVIAAGPYTLNDNLLYEPLSELMKYVIEYKPHLLILQGPFVPNDHKLLETLNETYSSYFHNILANVQKALEGTQVQVIIVSSHKDAHHHIIYPSLPYKLERNYENMVMAPSPCLLDINGLLIGATSADVLFHMGKQEISQNPVSFGGDRMARLANHLLEQCSFYPLHPPDPDVRIDYQLFEKFGLMDCLPHILILPSNLRYFVKKVKGCVVINPERLAKGLVAGTFARIEINPNDVQRVCDQISCEILRI